MSGKVLNSIIVFLFFLQGTFAQEVMVRGGFVKDHFEIGDNIDFWLTASYPERLELVLPDSLYDFGVFEYADKNYYPSKIKSGIIYDSAIYTLQCYEIDPIQRLKLPAILLSEGDSILIFSKPDSILFHQLVTQISDTTKLKTNLQFADVKTQFNYPLMWVLFGALLVVTVTIVLIFGKSIVRKIKLRKLKKDYIQFSDELTVFIRQLKEKPDKQTAELAVSKWKKFSERLESKPYSKLTSKEILALGYTAELQDPLRAIDRFIYGGLAEENLYKQFHGIEDFTQHRYSIVVDEIKNSK